MLLFLALSLALLWAISTASIAWMLTHPPRRTYASAIARGRPGDPGELDRPREFHSWSFRTRGMRLPVWSAVIQYLAGRGCAGVRARQIGRRSCRP